MKSYAALNARCEIRYLAFFFVVTSSLGCIESISIIRLENLFGIAILLLCASITLIAASIIERASEHFFLFFILNDSFFIEAQKKKIGNANELIQIIKQVLKTNQKTILLVIYNSQNQRRYIGVKLN